MKSNSGLMIFSLFAFFLLVFSGCVIMETNVKIKEDGKGNVDVIMDLSPIRTLMASMYSGVSKETINTQMAEFDANYSKENICKTMNTSMGGNLSASSTSELFDFSNMNCEGVDNYKARFYSDELDFVEAGNLVIEDNFFTKKYTMTFNEVNADNKVASPEQLNQYISMGASFSVNIEMPGEIVSELPEGAIIKEKDNKKNTISIDYFKNPNSLDGLVVVSESSNSMPLIIGAVVVLLIIVGAVFLLKKKN